MQVKIGHKIIYIKPPRRFYPYPLSVRQRSDTRDEPGVEAIYSGVLRKKKGSGINGELLIPSPPPPLLVFTSGRGGETCVTP